jgi:ferredoxin
LTELEDGYLVESHSEAAAAIVRRLPVVQASAAQIGAAEKALGGAAAQQVRRLPGRNLRDFLFARLEHPRWDAVAQRCVSCGNCTAVCPTCFCHAHVEEPEVEVQRGASASRRLREWDSCYTQRHSYIHGLTVRADTRARYRQWLTHKFGGWHDQFGRSGCVGCGRCITWCPVGIDVTEELAALAEEPLDE